MATLPSVADLLSGQTGYERGAQAFDNGYNGVRGMRVNDLAKSYFTGDPSTRDATLQQIAAINPQAADNISKWTMGQENQRNMQLANIARGVLSFKDPAAQRGVYQNTIMPAAQRQGLQIPEWDDATTPQWLQYQLASAGNQAGQGVQSTYVDGEGNRVAILRNGATQILGKNDAGANQQTISIDVNGVPTQVTFDRRTGRYTNAAIGGQAGGQQAPASGLQMIGGQQVFIDPSLPDSVRSGLIQSLQSGHEPQAMAVGTPSGTPLVGRTKEAEAAAVEAAKQQAQMQYLPQELGLRTQAAIDQTRGQEQVKANAELQAGEPKRQAGVQQTLTTIRNVIGKVDDAISKVNAWTAGPASTLSAIPGTAARNLSTDITTIKANLGFDRLQQMRDTSPTGGALGQVAVQELEALQASIDSLDAGQSPSQLKSNLAAVKTHYANWEKTVTEADRQARARVSGAFPSSPRPNALPQPGNYSNLWK